MSSGPTPAAAKSFVAVLLSLVAGQVDVVGFLACWHVFTTHMTGNTVHFAMSIVARHWADALRSGAVVPVFLLGSITGRTIIEFAVRKRVQRAASTVLVLEAASLSTCIWLLRDLHATANLWSSLFLMAFSMGLQTAAVTRVGPLTIHTSFVTGMLNGLAQRLSILLFWLVDRFRGRTRRSVVHSAVLQQAGLLTAVFFAYLGGAVLASLVVRSPLERPLFVCLGLLLVSFAIDQRIPLSVEEEEDEARQEQEEHRRRLAG